MTRNEGQASVILDNVCKLIQKKVHADNVLLVEKFAKALYSNMSKEDLAHRNDSDLYGAALSLWNSLEKIILMTRLSVSSILKLQKMAGSHRTQLSKLSLKICLS